MKPADMSNVELLLAVDNDPNASEVEKELARRLALALTWIDAAETTLQANGLLEESTDAEPSPQLQLELH